MYFLCTVHATFQYIARTISIPQYIARVLVM